MFKNRNNQNGFTIVELLISVSIFIVISTMAVGSLVVIFESNRQTSSLRLALDNANFALNSMTREIRTGRNFNCGREVCDGDDEISFKFSGDDITYRKTPENTIEKQINGNPSQPLTTDRYTVDVLRFTQTDTTPDLISVYMSGTASTGELDTSFDLQTSISVREL
jgi:type II secretory pathway pseudopilin PulG